MSPALAALLSTLGSFSLPRHAYELMITRSISRTAIEVALEFGRCVEIRGAQSFAIGRREVEKYRRDGIEPREFEGTQVVGMASGAVMTVYRNSDFRSLRTRRRRSFRW
ncbi:hypothetical protein HUA78_32495 [Myxococcus sp. CA033]|uniref:hypothetical protein n=1 Tax=Myxococcus sp. CA033 TaxID=2741516 RepID=UPI00157B1563|nr:hypothetical protein [Myxococcus sp. CA033]NTX39165.1 hypothetical protein [Myxococcus sp. CA033]